MSLRLLTTGLNLRAQGQADLAECVLRQVASELRDRHQTLERRLYPSLALRAHLTAENRRLEKLAEAGLWDELLPALVRQLARESQACYGLRAAFN